MCLQSLLPSTRLTSDNANSIAREEVPIRVCPLDNSLDQLHRFWELWREGRTTYLPIPTGLVSRWSLACDFDQLQAEPIKVCAQVRNRAIPMTPCYYRIWLVQSRIANKAYRLYAYMTRKVAIARDEWL